MFGPFTKGKAEVILRDFKALMVKNRCLREPIDGERREMLPNHMSDRLISAKANQIRWPEVASVCDAP